MKPTLQFRLSQHLTLTPQLQQSIRLLQLSTIELNQEIERLLMDNPILEREDGVSDAAAAAAESNPEAQLHAPTEQAQAESRDRAQQEAAAELPADYAAPWRGNEDSGDDEGDRTQAAPDL